MSKTLKLLTSFFFYIVKSCEDVMPAHRSFSHEYQLLICLRAECYRID